MGAIVSNPFEVASVRQMADLGKAPELTHQVGNTVQGAFSKVTAERGGFYRGLGPNIVKHAILNLFITGPFDYLRERMWITFGDVWPNTVV